VNAALVDTDVVSMLFKGDSRAASFRNHLAGGLLGISFMTLAELERWSLERRWGPARKADFTRYISKYTVIPVSRELCMEWALVTFRHAASADRFRPPMLGSRRLRSTIR
jgi:predicted nucleic acid-binding protein